MIMEPIIKGLKPKATKLILQLAIKEIIMPHKKLAKFDAIIDYKSEAKDFTKLQSTNNLSIFNY